VVQIEHQKISVKFSPLTQPCSLLKIFQNHRHLNFACEFLYVSMDVERLAKILHVFQEKRFKISRFGEKNLRIGISSGKFFDIAEGKTLSFMADYLDPVKNRVDLLTFKHVI